MDNGNMVGVMMVDLSAAFDMVDHNILMKKLEQFGLDSKAIAWMESYLYSRTVSCTEPAPYCYVMWMTVLSAWLVDLQSNIRLIINADKTRLLVLGTASGLPIRRSCWAA